MDLGKPETDPGKPGREIPSCQPYRRRAEGPMGGGGACKLSKNTWWNEKAGWGGMNYDKGEKKQDKRKVV